MKQNRYSEEQIAGILKETDVWILVTCCPCLSACINSLFLQTVSACMTLLADFMAFCIYLTTFCFPAGFRTSWSMWLLRLKSAINLFSYRFYSSHAFNLLISVTPVPPNFLRQLCKVASLILIFLQISFTDAPFSTSLSHSRSAFQSLGPPWSSRDENSQPQAVSVFGVQTDQDHYASSSSCTRSAPRFQAFV